jgi:hypothetical protein
MYNWGAINAPSQHTYPDRVGYAVSKSNTQSESEKPSLGDKIQKLLESVTNS